MATISGEWSGTIGDMSNPLTWHSYTVTEGGEYTVEATIAADAIHAVFVYLDGDNTDPLVAGYGEGEVTGSATVTLSAGVSLDFISYGTEAVPGTGTWSISSDVLAPDLPPNAVPVGSIDGVYYGATLAQALYHGSALLWGIHGTITPVPPVFLDEDPWIALPTVEHVTYQVSGTPGAGESVTVTAVPDEGWVLDGATTWSHEWEAPLPVVTITGTTSNHSRDQFRQACIDHGTTYDTVVELPFLLDTSSATSTLRLFLDCSSLISAPAMDTSQVTNMAYMFDGCSSLISAPAMDTSQVTTMSFMFRDCSSLTSVPDFDTSQVTSMSNMFRDCSSLTDGNVRLIGKHPDVSKFFMIDGSGLTREPFYDSNGNPI